MKRIAPYLWPIVLIVGAVFGAAATVVIRALAGPGGADQLLKWLSPVLASVAFALALVTFAFNWQKSKNDLFIATHDKLIAPEVQHGRRILARLDRDGSVGRLNREEFQAVNRALSLYETMAMYFFRGNINRESVELTWGQPMHARRTQIRAFIRHRYETDGYKSWPNLTRLVDRFEKQYEK